MRSSRRFALLAVLLAVASARAQVVPWQRIDVAQGLPATRVTAIERDPRGWMWVGTWEGVARLGGERVRAFGVADGLPRAFANDVAVSARGDVWIATKGGGLARLRAESIVPGEPAFERVDPENAPPLADASCLVVDVTGVVWCGTDAGIWRVEESSGGWSAACASASARFEHSGQACVDADGIAWLAAGDALYSTRNGRVERFDAPRDDGDAAAIVAARAGTLLVGFERGAWTCDPIAGAARRWTRVAASLPDGARVRALVDDADGGPWIGTTRGLVHGARVHGRDTGLADDSVRALALGPGGEPWVGTWSAGVARLASRAITSWNAQCGLPGSNVAHLALGDGGALVALERGLGWIDGDDRARALPCPPRFESTGQRFARDRDGSWWIAGDEGLWRAKDAAPDLGRATLLDDAACAPRAPLFGTPCATADGALWWSEWTGRTVRRDAHGACVEVDFGALRPLPSRVVHVRANGDAWLLSFDRLRRWRAGAVAELELEPFVATEPRCAHTDRAGRLWIGSRFRGLWLCDAPDDALPRFERAPLRLASEAVWSIDEDARGSLWLGTARGIVRVDPRTWASERIGAEHGLAGEIVTTVAADEAGRIWCATSGGVSRIDAGAATPRHDAPRTWILAARAGGADLALPARGADALDAGELAHDAASLEVEYGAPDVAAGGGVAYQHRFADGSAAGAWSEPRSGRALDLARLAPGEHRLEVRALAGGVPGEPATLRVRVRPPWWRTGWFAAVVAATVATGGALALRARRERRRAVEALRRRIADDVHDEVGAGLAQIAILAEASRAGAAPASDERLREAARVARALRGSVADIVRALDPTPEDLDVLATRARQIATNLFEAQGAEVLVRAAGLAGRRELDAERRRHVLRAIAELLANAARHSGARRVDVEIAAADGELRVVVADDGRGFDVGAATGGHGLAGLRRRAREAGGELEITSAPRAGTRAVLRVPLA